MISAQVRSRHRSVHCWALVQQLPFFRWHPIIHPYTKYIQAFSWDILGEDRSTSPTHTAWFVLKRVICVNLDTCPQHLFVDHAWLVSLSHHRHRQKRHATSLDVVNYSLWPTFMINLDEGILDQIPHVTLALGRSDQENHISCALRPPHHSWIRVQLDVVFCSQHIGWAIRVPIVVEAPIHLVGIGRPAFG